MEVQFGESEPPLHTAPGAEGFTQRLHGHY